MANENQKGYIGETTLLWGGSRVRTVTFTDISAEIALEALVRVDVVAMSQGTAPKRNSLPSRYRKRLANTRTF